MSGIVIFINDMYLISLHYFRMHFYIYLFVYRYFESLLSFLCAYFSCGIYVIFFCTTSFAFPFSFFLFLMHFVFGGLLSCFPTTRCIPSTCHPLQRLILLLCLSSSCFSSPRFSQSWFPYCCCRCSWCWRHIHSGASSPPLLQS